ncbi:MAG: hypothetical protein ACXVE7_15125 [Solirubrobacteraceae bacterium]
MRSTTMVGMDVDDLYGLPLDRFIAERASLVRTLRSAGEREQAAAMSSLRKPSVAAWAVNQLVRTQRREVESLFEAGDALRDAQAGVLAGTADAQDLRSASERERTTVDDLVITARGLLSSTGHELSAATLERVADTLHAAALDDEAREQVSEGRLVRELRHVGLGGGLGGGFPAPPARPAGKAAGATAEPDTATARRAARAAEQRTREQARKQARAHERDAAREVERAERAERGAQERRDRAAEALRQAEDAVADARAGRDAAIAAHRQAKQQLDTL